MLMTVIWNCKNLPRYTDCHDFCCDLALTLGKASTWQSMEGPVDGVGRCSRGSHRAHPRFVIREMREPQLRSEVTLVVIADISKIKQVF